MSELTDLDKKKLPEYYERFMRTNYIYKRLQLQFLWKYLHSSEIFSPLCGVIRTKAFPQFAINSHWIIWEKKPHPLPGDEMERIYLSYVMLEDIVSNSHDSGIIYRIGKQYMENKPGTEADYFNLFNDLFLEPFILFLVHHADKNVLILELLKKYKHRTEWFTGEGLFEIFQKNSNRGEHLLTSDLYSYLFDKGIDFHIESLSPAGRVDFVGSQMNSSVKTLIEGKVFDGVSRSKAHIAQGFRQLSAYTKEYNEDRSYLVIYNISPKKLVINAGGNTGNFPCLSRDNKSFYFIVIDIFPHEQPASKREKQEPIEINESDLY